MEALSTLTFKGSVTEAIFEAKGQKKLFLVYISGDDEDSDKLNTLTWTDASVAESLSKYCVLVHIQAGSLDATNFSAIYPYSSVPCIAAIGFSGTQVWKNEGFIAAEDLASSLEKAWVGLHFQETTASILSAALASQNSEQPASNASNVVLPSEGGSSNAAVVSPSTASSVQPSETKSTVTSASNASNVVLPSEGGSSNAAVESPPTASSVQPSETKATVTSASTKEKNDGTVSVKGKESAEPSNFYDTTNNQPGSSVDGSKANVEHGATEIPLRGQAEKELILPAAPSPNDKTSSTRSSTDRKRKQETVIKKADSGSGGSERAINVVKSVGTKDTVKTKDEGEDGKSLRKSSDVHLNIRLPDGANLQEKFSVTSILRMVKDYVNSNQTTGLGAYDLAVPYPRKVYSDQDLDKSLSELGLFDRQALIVVPRKKATVYQRGPSYSESNNNTDPNGGGYFAYVRRVLSYANPFSYFGGSTASTSISGPERQAGPSTELRNDMGQVGSSYQDPSEGRSNVRNRRATTSRIGSNIHTLKHDEDEAPFGDGNAFWNGNSTQYGGGSGGDSNDRQ